MKCRTKNLHTKKIDQLGLGWIMEIMQYSKRIHNDENKSLRQYFEEKKLQDFFVTFVLFTQKAH